jgi:phosphoserine phosphatase RsbU/P
MILDPTTHKVTLVNAGHLNPMRYRLKDKSLVEVITNDECGPPMAICEDYPYTSIEFSLEPGDIIFTFTDGVTDSASPSGELFEFVGVNNTVLKDSPMGPLTRPKMLGERLMHNVRKHANGTPQSDDIAIVSFGRLTPEEAAKSGETATGSNGGRTTKEYVAG